MKFGLICFLLISLMFFESSLCYNLLVTLSSKSKSKSKSKTKSKLKHKATHKLTDKFRFYQDAAAEPAGAEAAAGNGTEAKDLEAVLKEGWLKISSEKFLDEMRFPIVKVPNKKKPLFKMVKIMDNVAEVSQSGEEDESPGIFRKNEKGTEAGAPNEASFYFRLTGRNLYYTATKEDMVVLGAIAIENIQSADPVSDLQGFCFKVFDTENDEWDLCAEAAEEKSQWVLEITKAIGLEVGKNVTMPEAEESEVIKQPVILLPLPSRFCNERWNYQEHGDDWECICKEGHEQSPIDLTLSSGCMTMRQFRTRNQKSVRKKMKKNDLDLNRSAVFTWNDINAGEWEMEWQKNLIKMKPKGNAIFGTAEDIDYLEYEGKELLFHTPSDHTINGEQFPMEIQAVFYPANDRFKLVVSWLISLYPGSTNEFTDKIDLLNLPNQVMKTKKFSNESDVLNLKHLFHQSYMLEFGGFFNYFYYQGSLTSPPCDEHVRWIVVEEPLLLGSTFVEMFKDAMTTVPNIIDADTGEEAVVSPKLRVAMNPTGTNRKIQDIGIRKVYHFDLLMSPCNYPYSKFDEEEITVGHYEAMPTQMNNYVWVPGKEPSGFPGAEIIGRREALDLKKKKINDTAGVFSNGI